MDLFLALWPLDTPAGRSYSYKNAILLVSMTVDKDGKVAGLEAVDNC